MKQPVLAGTIALGLALAGCSSDPGSENDADEDNDIERIELGDDASSETVDGATDGDAGVGSRGSGVNAGPNGGTTSERSGVGTGSRSGSAGTTATRGSNATGSNDTSKLIKGGSDTAGTKPPAGSKLQRADPQ